MMAGKSSFTIASKPTGKTYKFKVNISDDGSVHFVSVLWGSGHKSSYRYLGIIGKDGVFKTTRRSAGQLANNPQAKAFDWVLRYVSHPGAKDLVNLEFWKEEEKKDGR